MMTLCFALIDLVIQLTTGVVMPVKAYLFVLAVDIIIIQSTTGTITKLIRNASLH